MVWIGKRISRSGYSVSYLGPFVADKSDTAVIGTVKAATAKCLIAKCCEFIYIYIYIYIYVLQTELL